MSLNDIRPPERPLPRLGIVAVMGILFTVFGGPLAWFLQLCTGYALATQPCFRGGSRSPLPPPALQWTWPAMVLCMIAAIVIALLAFSASWRAYRRSREETLGDTHRVFEEGAGRTRFLALWGMVLGCGSAIVAAFTTVAFMTLPRCAG